jgi:hypothetical protein
LPQKSTNSPHFTQTNLITKLTEKLFTLLKNLRQRRKIRIIKIQIALKLTLQFLEIVLILDVELFHDGLVEDLVFLVLVKVGFLGLAGF